MLSEESAVSDASTDEEFTWEDAGDALLCADFALHAERERESLGEDSGENTPCSQNTETHTHRYTTNTLHTENDEVEKRVVLWR
jgi:hypothetical protein